LGNISAQNKLAQNSTIAFGTVNIQLLSYYKYITKNEQQDNEHFL